MIRTRLQETIDEAAASPAFRNYTEVRERVLDMLDEAQGQADSPSDYWEEELEGFDYVLDASPLVVRKLREHCYHLTGLRSNEYRRHHAHRRGMFAHKLRALREQDADNLFVPESPALGGFGFEVDGALVNLDTLKYYECLIAMNRAGQLAPFRAGGGGQRKVVIEIGGGWGALAYQFKTLFPETTYVIVDLPQTLIFSAVYLRTLFPESSAFIYGDSDPGTLSDKSYDFIFLPHYFFPRARFDRVDLAINTVSFQEMTSGQVGGYAEKLSELKCAQLYSLNRDRSPHNSQLTAVSEILKKYYDLKEATVLDVPYTVISAPGGGGVAGRARGLARKILPATRTPPVYEYKHLAGGLKSSAA